MYKVLIIEKGNEIILNAEQGQNLLDLLKLNKISINSPCRGKGFCGKCKIRILEDSVGLKPMDPVEIDHISMSEKQAGYRLACRININGDLTIELPSEEGEAQILVSGLENPELEIKNNVYKTFLQIDYPTLEDQRSDMARIEDKLNGAFNIEQGLLAEISYTIRNSDYKVTITKTDDTIINVQHGNRANDNYGIGVDIGTTTVVGYLMNLNTGRQIDVFSALNPQSIHGADVISRIDYTVEKEDGLNQLSQLIRKKINEMISYFTVNNGIDYKDINWISLVGNTIMTHLFLQLPVKEIAVSPFIPVITRRYSQKARDLSININPQGIIDCLPGVASYIGSDTVGAVLSCGMAEEESISLMIDIGTNGEMVLGNKNGMVCCSTAAGPAFEGVHIRDGVGGVRGAINSIRIEQDVEYTTIGGEKPLGICGSGIVDGVSELLKAGIIDSYGRLKSATEIQGEEYKRLKNRIIDVDGITAFSLVQNESKHIIINQKDIREVQLAKGAIAAGIQILFKEMGISYEEVNAVYLAGGFGNYIDYNSAANMGLIPKPLINRIIPVGNGAGMGAKLALLSKDYRDKAESIKNNMRYIELSTRIDFQQIFVDCLEFSS